jgi:hypothetical protein
MRFHGVEFMGRKLRVEEIRDDPRKGRVRVPERMVSYVVGAAKPVSKRNNSTGGMRRVSRLESPPKKTSVSNKKSIHTTTTTTTTSSSTTLPPFATEKKENEKRYQVPNTMSLFSCLKRSDQEEMNRAVRRGFVSLEGLGYGTCRSKSRLASTHRQWCDELEKPQIVHCKAVHDDQLDRIIVDLSPLRISSAVMGDDFDVDDFLVRWKVQIATAAVVSGMEMLQRDNLQNSYCERLSTLDDNDRSVDCDCDFDDVECAMLFECLPTVSTEYVLEVGNIHAGATWQPISRLPVVTMGVFEGDRSKAKAMAKQLAQLWDIPLEIDFDELRGYGSTSDEMVKGNLCHGKASRQKRDRKRENKKRRRSTRGDLDLLLRYK